MLIHVPTPKHNRHGVVGSSCCLKFACEYVNMHFFLPAVLHSLALLSVQCWSAVLYTGALGSSSRVSDDRTKNNHTCTVVLTIECRNTPYWSNFAEKGSPHTRMIISWMLSGGRGCHNSLPYSCILNTTYNSMWYSMSMYVYVVIPG